MLSNAFLKLFSFSVKDFLEKKGIEKNKILFELFNINNKTKTTHDSAVAAPENKLISNITVKQDGRSFDFLLPYNGNNILNAAMETGADLPFACKKGVCCTCKAKLVAGEVEMDRVYGLEPDEIDEGYILTCQSHPRSEKIIVDFDI